MNTVAKRFFKGARGLLDACEWRPLAFLGVVRAAQAAISATGSKGSHERWQEHQDFSRFAHEERAKVVGCDLVVGVFDAGIAQELSLFSGYPETVTDQIYIGGSGFGGTDSCVIGVGCSDLARTIQAITWKDDEEIWSLDEDQDWGWVDGMGTHVEEYDAATRVYTRSSMTGRTSYRIKFVGSYGYVIEPTAEGASNPLPEEGDPIAVC